MQPQQCPRLQTLPATTQHQITPLMWTPASTSSFPSGCCLPLGWSSVLSESPGSSHAFPHRASASCSFYLYATACSRCLTSCWLAPICYPPNWGGHFFIPPEQDTEERKPRNVISQTSPFSLTCSPHSQGCNLQTVCMWALTSPWSQLTKALDEHLLQALANQSPSPWNLKLEFKLVLEQRWPVGSQSGYYWISIREIRGNLICADRQQWSRSRDKRPYGQEREESKLSNSRNLGFPILSSSLSSSSALSLSSMNYP